MMGVVVTTLLVLLPLAGAVAAQSTETESIPDFSTGWVLRSAEVASALDGGQLAGTALLGYVVIGLDGEAHYSRTGEMWEPISLPPGIQEVDHFVDIAASARGFVAIANPNEPNHSVFVAFSPDGRNWEQADPAELPQPLIEKGGVFEVTAGPDGFVIVGVEECAVFAWFSPNGRNWTLANLPQECGSLLIAPADDRWVAAASSIEGGEVSVLSSRDGVNWLDSEATAPPPMNVLSRDSIASMGETLVLAGAQFLGNSEMPALWTSSDGGLTWIEAPVDVEVEERLSELALFPMVVNDLGFVGSFYREIIGGELEPGAIVYSPDGATWFAYSADEIFFEMVGAGDSVVALGVDGVYTWTPPGSDLLAFTGTGMTGRLVSVGVAMTVIGLAALFFRRSDPARTKCNDATLGEVA